MKRPAFVLPSAIVVAIAMTAYGYTFFFATHPSADTPIPLWVKLSVPFAVIGPDFPSMAQFIGVVTANLVAWFLVVFGVLTVAARFRAAK